MNDVMIDLEALSTRPDGAIIAIGMCLFDETDILDEEQILIDPQFTPGHRDPDTLEWWKQQPLGTFNNMMSGIVLPWYACQGFASVIGKWKPEALWANPPTFDISMMRHLFQTYDEEFPVHYSDERDFRTLRKFADALGIDYSKPYEEREAHDALSDAICQAKALQIILRDLALL